jgi:hypothetical protein
MVSVVFRPRNNKYARAISVEPEQSLFYLVSIHRTGVRGQALIAVPQVESKGLITFDGKWNLNRIQSFFSEHALKSEVKPKTKTGEERKVKDDEERKQKIKTEL